MPSTTRPTAIREVPAGEVSAADRIIIGPDAFGIVAIGSPCPTTGRMEIRYALHHGPRRSLYLDPADMVRVA